MIVEGWWMLLWTGILWTSGVLVFSRGFLLTRQTSNLVSDCQQYSNIPCGPREATHNNITNGHDFYCTPSDRLSSLLQDFNASTKVCMPRRAKVVLMVIDALKYEFTEYNETLKNPLPYQNGLPVIHELLKSTPERTRHYKFIADPPTTTLQRLKGLTTGSLPTFIDAGSNFATPEINEDNYIDQLRKRGSHAVLLGDDTWINLYPKRWIRSVALPSFNVWDLDTVDNAIVSKLPEEMANKDWSLLVTHFLGVDHCGHKYGPNHPEMKRKLTEMDNVIRSIIQSMDNETMLFVIGDHGMTATGDHGGETEAEVTAGMFVYSPYKLFSPPDVLSPTSVRQIDLVPTLSAILGLPPPYSNLGAIILNALPFPPHMNIPFKDWQFALFNLWANVKQVMSYIVKYSERSDEFTDERIDNIEKKFIILSHRVQSIYSERGFQSFATDAREFLIEIRSMCQEVWVQFDSFSMSRGLLLTFLTIFFCYTIVEGIPSNRLAGILQSSFLWCSYGVIGLSIMGSIICHAFLLIDNLEMTILFSIGMISVIMLAMLVIQNWDIIASNWYEMAKKRNWLDAASKASLALSACALFSNSYIVEEANVHCFLLFSLLLCACHSGNSPKLLFPMFLACGAVVTLSRYYRVCREEQGECYIKGLDTTQATTAHIVTALTSLAILVSLTRLWLRSCGNLTAPGLLFWKYAPTALAVCIGGHWVMQAGPQKAQWRANSLAQAVYAIIFISIIEIVINPLSLFQIKNHRETISVHTEKNIVPQLFNHIKGLFGNKMEKLSKDEYGNMPIVCGLGNAYSATFVMFSVYVTLLIGMLLGGVSAPSIILLYTSAVFVLCILAIVRYNNSADFEELINVDSCSVQCWVLLSLYFFYGTGHQPALSSIQWNAAFVGTGGHFIHNIIPATLVIVNTFGSNILMGMMVPLLVMAPFSIFVIFGNPSRGLPLVDMRGELLLYEHIEKFAPSTFNVCAKYMLFHAIRTFICMLAATVHCRHLMVWKIFAPKFIFEAIGLLVTIASVLVGYLLLLRIQSRLRIYLDKVTKTR